MKPVALSRHVLGQTARKVRLSFALALILGCATAALSQTTLKPEDARLTAAKLLAAGKHRASAEITSVLIERDASDTASLILHSHAMRNLGNLDTAQNAARNGWRTATRDLEKYGAALAMAQALSSADQKTRAQVWLRRAAHVAPTPQMRARAVRDYQFVRKTNPWSVGFSFGITPSDNVNNAPRDNTIVLGGLVFEDPNAVPISGLEFQTQLSLRYNFNEKQTSRNYVSLQWTENQIVFTDDDAPDDVSASDFAFRRLEATLGRDFTNGPNKPRQTVSLSFGKLWSGGDVLADEVRLGWRQTFTKPRGRVFSWDAKIGYSDRKDNDLRSGVTSSLGARWSRPLESGARLGWHASVGRTNTDSLAVTHTSLSAGMHYTLGKPIMGAVAQLTADVQARDYDAPLFGPDARQDFRTTLSASLLFVDFDTYGFAPKLTLEATQTNSNITRFETRNLGLQIGFQSLF